MEQKIYKQQIHGIPQYRILNAVLKMNTPGENGKKRWATASRIANELGEPIDYIQQMLKYYWGKNYVIRKPIKNASRQDLKANYSSFHWVLTKAGKLRYYDLQQKFGDISLIENQWPEIVSATGDSVQQLSTIVHAISEITGQKTNPDSVLQVNLASDRDPDRTK